MDFIAINKRNEAGIVAAKAFTADSTEEEIRSYVNTTKAAGEDAPHYINSIPPAIENTYLEIWEIAILVKIN